MCGVVCRASSEQLCEDVMRKWLWKMGGVVEILSHGESRFPLARCGTITCPTPYNSWHAMCILDVRSVRLRDACCLPGAARSGKENECAPLSRDTSAEVVQVYPPDLR